MIGKIFGFTLFKMLADNTLKGRALNDLAQVALGPNEGATIVYTGASVDGDSFVVGGDSFTFNQPGGVSDTVTDVGQKYWVKLLSAGALTLGNTVLNNTAVPSDPTFAIPGVQITGHGMSVGQVFGVGTEFFCVTAVQDANTVSVQRGWAGSTVAAHASGATVLAAANYTNVDLIHDLVLPV